MAVDVQRGYKASGRTTARAIAFMGLGGLFASVALAATSDLILWLFSDLWFPEPNRFLEGANLSPANVSLVLFVVALTLIPGRVIGWTINYCGKVGKNRSFVVAAATALLFCGVYLIVGAPISVLFPDAVVSWPEQASKAWYISVLLLTVVPVGYALWTVSRFVDNTPFCETCNAHMQHSDKIASPAVSDLEYVLDTLQARHYVRVLSKYPYKNGRIAEYTWLRIHLYFCKTCHTGFLEATQVIEAADNDSSDETKVVYSSAVSRAETETIVSVLPPGSIELNQPGNSNRAGD